MAESTYKPIMVVYAYGQQGDVNYSRQFFDCDELITAKLIERLEKDISIATRIPRPRLVIVNVFRLEA